MKNDLCVLAGPASKDLAGNIAKTLGAELVDVELRIFPDGESKVRIAGELDGKVAVVVQSTYPPVDTHLMQLLFIIGRAKKTARRIVAVIPYLAYARQDKEFLKGEAVSMELVAGILNSAGIDGLVTVDIHSQLALSHFTIQARNVTAIQLLANYFKSKKLEQPLAVSPDIGGVGRAHAFAGFLGIPSIALPKSRDRASGEVTIDTSAPEIRQARGRDVILIDDMISTGSSVVKAAQVLRSAGCGKIFVACTHALLVGGALEKITAAGAGEVIGTNTVPSSVSKVDVAPVICDELRKLDR